VRRLDAVRRPPHPPGDHDLVRGGTAKRCAGFRPQGQVRQPGADASPNSGNAPCIQSRGKSLVPKARSIFQRFPHKRRPRRPGGQGARGPGSFAGWVRGWGAGGHSTRRWLSNTREGVPFRSSQKLFSGSPPQEPSAARARPIRPIDRQVHVPAVGKFQIPRLDTKVPAATAFDHVARADGKSAGQTICLRAHGTSWNSTNRAINRRSMPQPKKLFQIGAARAPNTVDICGKTVKRGCYVHSHSTASGPASHRTLPANRKTHSETM
jgi:hypothetical protein